jgi:hypothetical protein
MNKIKIASFFIAVLSFFVPSTSLANASASSTTETSASSTSGSVLGLQTPLIPPTIAKIKEAKALLAGVTLNHALLPVYKKNTKTLLRYNLGSKDIALAIFDPASSSTIITIGRQNGKSMVFPDQAVDVKLVRFNGVNSKFQVSRPEGGKIVALKYLISPTESGSKAAIEKALSEAIYVPYSADLGAPDVIEYGSNYLNDLIDKVTSELQHTPSQSMPGQTITKAIPPAMIKALIYAEHTDTAQVLNGNDIRTTINQLNILLAANEGDTYKYSVSSAGARGIAQFIPSTYKSLVNRRPETGLIPDFVEGMSNHQNAIKAMYLLLDDYAGAVRVKGSLGFVSSRIFDYGAASYNGGTTRVARAVNFFGPSWNEDKSAQLKATQAQVNSLTAQVKKAKDKQTKASLQQQLTAATNQLNELKSGALRNETVNYLVKIYKVIQYFNDEQA